MESTFDLVALGELLYALRAPYSTLLERTRTLNCHCTGAEANVAIGASRLGLNTAIISKVCRNFIGDFIVDELRAGGVDAEGVARSDAGRMGIIYQEYGIPPRPSRNVYDRVGASVLTLTPDEVDWSIIENAKCFYVSGVTAALGDGPRDLIREAFRRAATVGTLRIFDANFRSALWSEAEAGAFVESILPEADICFIKADDARRILGKTGSAEQVLEQIRSDYGVKLVVETLGADGAIASDGKLHKQSAIALPQMINRFGLGDAFAAGFMYGYFKHGLSEALCYGTAAAALKTTYTDESYIQFGVAEVEALIASSRDGTAQQGGISR